MKIVLSIAGSDSGAGAGIQADLKTISAHGLYAVTVVTAVTAQNTQGVFGVLPVGAGMLARQLDCVLRDLPPDAVKIGMLPDAESVRVTAEMLERVRPPHIVLDPVMLSSSGHRLMDAEACGALAKQLFPLAEVITPNLPETEVLSGMPVRNPEEAAHAAAWLHARYGCAVLCKGGHRDGPPDDLLCIGESLYRFPGERIDNPDSHGTGCTLSSAIACRLAQGEDLPEAVRLAKAYLTGALRAGLHIGHGAGPMQHFYRFTSDFA